MELSSPIDEMLANIRDPREAIKQISLADMERLIAQVLSEAVGESLSCTIHSLANDPRTGAELRLSLRVKGQSGTTD